MSGAGGLWIFGMDWGWLLRCGARGRQQLWQPSPLFPGADPSMLSKVLDGHTDAVWGLAFSPFKNRLASCSADGTIRIWDPSSSDSSCLSTYSTEGGELALGRQWPQGRGVCVSKNWCIVCVALLAHSLELSPSSTTPENNLGKVIKSKD